MTGRNCIFICLAVVFAALATPDLALAEKRIVVLDFEGASSSRLRDTVAALIRVRHQVISDAKYQRMAKRLGVKGLEADGVAQVAQAIEADGVLTGELTRHANRRYSLVLRLRAGADGEPVKRFKLWLKSPRLSARLKSQLSARLLAAIDGLPLIEHAGPRRSRDDDRDSGSNFQESLEVDDVDAADDDSETLEVEDENTGRVADSGGDGGGDGGDGGDNGSSSGGGADVSKGSGGRRGGGDELGGVDWRSYAHASAASVNVGASLVARNLTFTTTPADFAQAPQGYDGPLAPGVYAGGEVYPLAFLPRPHPLLTMVGVGFEVDRVVGLKTAIASGGMEILAPTAQMRYSVGLRARYNILGNSSLPTIKFGFGLGSLSFDVNRDDLPLGVVLDVPNTAYSYLEPTFSVHVPVTRRVAVTAGGVLMIITDAGEVQTPEQYGAALVKGYSAGLGVDVLALRNLVVRLSTAYTAVDFEFRGTGVQTNGRDGDDTTQDVAGAHDRYLNSVLTAGYLF